MKILLLILAALTTGYITAQPRQMTCIQDYKCVQASQCRSTSEIVYPCNEEQNRVCCPAELLVENATVVVRTSAFPKSCGSVSTTDRITGGEIATVGQFPWMALLGYILQGVDLAQFLCGGSIITHKYILTAAHCINIDSRFKLEIVRLGELNLETVPDCETDGKKKICADPHIDLAVDKTIPHRSFNNVTLENDIALVKIKGRISFTDFIQPVCLPFQNDIDYETIVNKKLTVSGWGKINAGELGGSTKLMYAEVTVWDQNICNNSVPPKIRPIRDSQLCANGATRQDACKGDSGGPLTNTTFIIDDLRNYQIGIVSFASAQICGNAELPTIYTRVDFYLDWIVDNVK